MKKAFYTILLFLMVLLASFTASAITLSLEATGADVRSLQLRLGELDYYTSNVSGVFDPETQAAIDLFRRQIGLQIADGIDDTTWEALFSFEAPAYQKTTDTPQLVPGSTGAAVTALQVKLLELGCFREEFTPGLYDPATQYAQDRFCKNHHIVIQSGATSELQKIILSQSNTNEESSSNNGVSIPLDASAKVSFLQQQIKVGTLVIPTVILYIAMVFLMMFAILLTFCIEKKRSSQTNPRGESLKLFSQSQETALHLSVVYQNKIRQLSFPLGVAVSIGRASEQVPLDSSDAGASRQHCDLYFGGNTLILRDHSQSGTFINGEHIHNAECPAKKGDNIQISKHTLTIDY